MEYCNEMKNIYHFLRRLYSNQEMQLCGLQFNLSISFSILLQDKCVHCIALNSLASWDANVKEKVNPSCSLHLIHFSWSCHMPYTIIIIIHTDQLLTCEICMQLCWILRRGLDFFGFY